MRKRSVNVNIAGQRFQVRSDADETYIRTLAEFVNQRIEEIRSSTRPVPTQKLTVLAAMNIADELLQEQKKRSDLKETVRTRGRAVLTFLDKEERKYFGTD